MRRIIDPQEGFTLVEILVAVFVIAFSFMGTLLAFTKSSIYISNMRQNTIASQALQEEMEKVRDKDFNTILSEGNQTFNSTGFSALKNATGNRYVMNDPNYNSIDIRKVTTTVAWDAMDGRNMTKSISTLVTRSGINRQ